MKVVTLLSVISTLLVAAADPCTQYGNQLNCDANTTCTWCKCAAVPSSCFTKEQAKKLPPAVFACDSLNNTSIQQQPENKGAAGQCQNMKTAGTHTIQITSSGKTRSFDLFVPKSLASNDPRAAVFVWHGFSGSPSKMQTITKASMQGELYKWFVVYPKGTGLIKGFNGAGCCPGVSADDVQFARDIVEWLKMEMCLDTSRVFSTGFSNGGFMSNRLGCEAADVFKAIAPHSGTMGKTFTCNPSKGVPVMMFHGDADPTVPFFGNGQWFSFAEVATKWATLNECKEGTARDGFTSETTTCVRYDSCGRDNVPFEYCEISGLAHNWSGERDYDVDATGHLFKFFDDLN